MTFPAIVSDNQTYSTGGTSYVSILAQKRWKQRAVTAVNLPLSITTDMLANDLVTPEKLYLTVIFGPTPPPTPTTAARYVVTATATGAWAGREGAIAHLDGTAWQFVTPRAGYLVWSAGKLWHYTGSAWAVVNEFTLPARLAGESNTALADVFDITESGWYLGGISTLNVPYSANWMLEARAHGGAGWITVYATQFTADTPQQSITFKRSKNNGVWESSWFQTLETLSELDARYYVRLPNSIVGIAVIDRTHTAPPLAPAVGDLYYVKATATGAWAGHSNQIALYTSTGWTFTTPLEGTPIWINDEDVLIYAISSGYKSLGSLIATDQESLDAVAPFLIRPLRPSISSVTVTAVATRAPDAATLELWGSNDGGVTFALRGTGTNSANFNYTFSNATDWYFYTRISVGTINGVRSELSVYYMASGGSNISGPGGFETNDFGSH